MNELPVTLLETIPHAFSLLDFLACSLFAVVLIGMIGSFLAISEREQREWDRRNRYTKDKEKP